MASAANFSPSGFRPCRTLLIRRITADIELMADDEADDVVIRYYY